MAAADQLSAGQIAQGIEAALWPQDFGGVSAPAPGDVGGMPGRKAQFALGILEHSEGMPGWEVTGEGVDSGSNYRAV